jgi:hypothetical protein
MSFLYSTGYIRRLAQGTLHSISASTLITEPKTSHNQIISVISHVSVITVGSGKIIGILLRSSWRRTLMMGRTDVYI